MMASVSGERGETSAVASHIASVASRLFAARGYDATSVRTIVEAAGVTKPTLYYHFGSKEGLAQALVTRPLNGLLNGLGAIIDAPGDPVEKMAGILQAHFAFCRDDPDRVRFIYALFFGPLGTGLSTELARFGEAMDALIARAVDDLAGAGRVGRDRMADCMLACRGMIVISTMDYLYKGADLDDDLARRLVGHLLDGFGGAPLGRE